MRTVEEITGTLGRWRHARFQAEELMNNALANHSEFAYNAHKDSLKKAENHIEMLEYVLGERE